MPLTSTVSSGTVIAVRASTTSRPEDFALRRSTMATRRRARPRSGTFDAMPPKPRPDAPRPDTMDAVYTKPGYLFRRMQQIAVSIFLEECREFDLTPVQYAALVAIRAHPGIDATRLSAVIAYDRSTLGSVVERLEAKEWVRRAASAGDKRVKLLTLTPAGAALLRQVEDAVERAQARMLAPLKAADRSTLMALLSQLVDLNNEASRVPLRPDDAIAHAKKSG